MNITHSWTPHESMPHSISLMRAPPLWDVPLLFQVISKALPKTSKNIPLIKKRLPFQVISKALPKTSKNIPALSLFYMAAMVTSSCSLLGTCLVLVVHFTGNRKGIRPVPKWIVALLPGRWDKMKFYPSLWIPHLQSLRKNLSNNNYELHCLSSSHDVYGVTTLSFKIVNKGS